jgi:RNA polymerase sigma factor (sigma-70 family)
MATNNQQQQMAGALFQSAEADLRSYVRSQLGSNRASQDIEVEDVVQETFLRICASKDPGKIRNPRGFLFRIARNLIIDLGRRRKAQPYTRLIPEKCSDNEMPLSAEGIRLTPERVVSGQQDLDIVIEALGKLPDKCQAAFNLQRSTGCSYAKVARELNMSESMVQKHMARALYAIHKALQ